MIISATHFMLLHRMEQYKNTSEVKDHVCKMLRSFPA